MFPRLPARATFVADTNFVSGTQKNVSDFVQKHFVSATNVSQFAQPKKYPGQQCVRNNKSSFTRAFSGFLIGVLIFRKEISLYELIIRKISKLEFQTVWSVNEQYILSSVLYIFCNQNVNLQSQSHTPELKRLV